MTRRIIILYLVVFSISLGSSKVYDTAICVKKTNGNYIEDSNETIYGGLGNFKDLVQQSKVFVDKSLLIKEVLEHNSTLILITCPRKFGKSVNLDMIKTFLEIQVDDKGHPCRPYHNASNYRLFKHGEFTSNDGQKENFSHTLLITKHPELFEKYMGKYPVVYIKFLIPVGLSYSQTFQTIMSKISETFLQHQYLADKFDKIINDDNATSEARIEARINHHKFTLISQKVTSKMEEVEKSLKLLCKLLYEHYGKRVFVLIDDYDGIIHSVLNNPQLSTVSLTKAADYLKHLLEHTFYNNEYLEKGIMTGIFRLGDKCIFEKLNDIAIYDALNNQWSHFYGFNHDEVDALFQHANMPLKQVRRGIYKYYGYQMNKKQNESAFNPWSIADFLRYKEVENYWEMTSDSTFLTEMFHIKALRRTLEALLHDKPLTVPFSSLQFSLEDFLHLKELFLQIDRNFVITGKTVTTVLAYLCATGYLTHDGASYNEKAHTNITVLRLPNNEVAVEWRKRLAMHYDFAYKLDGKNMMLVADALEDFINNEDKHSEMLENYVKQLLVHTSIYTEPIDDDDDFMLDVILSYLSLEMRYKKRFYTILRNETDKPDLILMKNDRGAILKFALEPDTAEKTVQDLIQYGEVFEANPATKFIKYISIAVSPDNVVHVYGEFENKIVTSTKIMLLG